MTDPSEAEVLRVVKRMAVESSAPLIYLHDPEGGKPYAALIPQGPLLSAAEKGMEEAGWNIYDHDHRDGDEEVFPELSEESDGS